jgi:hypothetical protein
MTLTQEPVMDPFDENHAHTARCWWDCDEAQWVCSPADAPIDAADDHDAGQRR